MFNFFSSSSSSNHSQFLSWNYCLYIFKYASNFLLFSLFNECQQTHKHKISILCHWIRQRNDEPLYENGENRHTHTQIPFSITYVFVCSQINYTMSDWNPITVLLATVINRCWNVWICHVEWLYLQMVEWAKERVREKKMILPNGKCLANKVKTEWTDNMCVWERGCEDTSVPILKTDCIVYRCI